MRDSSSPSSTTSATSAEVTRTLAEPETGGITWGTVIAAILVALLAGGFVGNVFASRRRPPQRLSIYGSIQQRIEQERAGARDRVGMSGSHLAHGVFASVDGEIRRQEVAEDGRGIWDELAAKLDPAEFRPELAPDIEVREFKLRWGNDYAMIANPRDLLHYKLEPGEIELLPLMDGTRTVKEIVVERFRESGDIELSGVADLVRQLQVGNFLTTRFHDVDAAVRRAMVDVTAARLRAREFAKTQSIEWKDAHRLVDWFYRRTVAVVLHPVGRRRRGGGRGRRVRAVLVGRTGRAATRLSGESAAAESLLLLAMSYFLTFMHELGHAVVLVHYKRRVKSAGFMMYFGSPAFFVESSDGLMLDRRERIVQSFAGPYTELIIAGAASALVWAFPEWSIAPVLYKFALLNYFVIFLNLVPMLELDGYWILSDFIQVPDLRPRSLQFIRYDVWHKLRRRERFTKQEVGLGLYAVLGVAFTILSLYWSVFFWEEVFGGLIEALWDGGPITRVLLIAAGAVRARSDPARPHHAAVARSTGRCSASCRRSGSGSRRGGGSRRPS